MTDKERDHVLTHARQFVVSARDMEEAGEVHHAEQAWSVAEDRYVEAGVDPDWFDERALMDAFDAPPPMLTHREASDGRVTAVETDSLDSREWIEVDAEWLFDRYEHR